jgi:hypothetical protein
MRTVCVIEGRHLETAELQVHMAVICNTNAQGELAQVREMLKTADERLVKAEARSDLFSSAYASLDAGRTTGRRQ